MHKLASLCYIFFSFLFFSVSTFILFQLITLRHFCKVIKINLENLLIHSHFYEKEIRLIYKIIFNINDAIVSWNYFNGFLVFGGYIFVFSITSSEFYYLCVSAIFTNLLDSDGIFYVYNACNIVWCLPMILTLSFIGKFSSDIYREIETCISLLRNSHGDNQAVKRNMEKFLMIFNQVKFTTNDFFDIDDSMIHKVRFLYDYSLIIFDIFR